MPNVSEVKVHSLLVSLQKNALHTIDVSYVVHTLVDHYCSFYYVDHVYTEVCKNRHSIGQVAGLSFK